MSKREDAARQRRFLVDYYGGACGFCGSVEGERGRALKLTSLAPYGARGGGEHPRDGEADENVVPACQRCIQVKGSRDLEQLRAYLRHAADAAFGDDAPGALRIAAATGYVKRRAARGPTFHFETLDAPFPAFVSEGTEPARRARPARSRGRLAGLDVRPSADADADADALRSMRAGSPGEWLRRWAYRYVP